MDISDTLAPKSDQMDYEDLITGPRVFTITAVRKGPSVDQPVQVDLAELDRPWRPAKSMRRLIVAAWGADTSQYIGRKIRLFGDSTVKFGGMEVGGIRVSHLSHIDKPLTVALMATRGKRTPTVVQPLEDQPETPVEAIPGAVIEDWIAQFDAAETVDDLISDWNDATKAGVTRDPRVVAAKDARKAELAEGA